MLLAAAAVLNPVRRCLRLILCSCHCLDQRYMTLSTISLHPYEQSHGHSFHVSCQYPSNSSMKHRGRGSQLSFVRPSGLVACFPVFSVKMPLPLRSEGCWGDNVAWDAPNPRTHRRVSPWSWIGQHRARIPRSDNASARKKDTRVVMHCRERALMCGSRWLRLAEVV